MLPELIICSTAKVSELLEVGCGSVPTIDNIGHVSCQHKWGSIPLQEHVQNKRYSNSTGVYQVKKKVVNDTTFNSDTCIG